MVFSRYASIFRITSKISSSRNILATRELFNDENVQFRDLKNSRYHVTRSSEKNDIATLRNVETTNISNCEENFSKFSSKPATQLVDTAMKIRQSDVDKFGKDCSTSLDENNDDASISNYSLDDVKLPGPLEHCDEDISHVSPWNEPSFNFASYANDSQLLQELAKLGVNLSKVEKRPMAMQLLLKRTFDDVKPYIQFLHDCGVVANEIGSFITKNPMILGEDIDDLSTRIRYLRAHNFTTEMVARIVCKNPFWLMFNTKRIDARLGYFQREYQLNGNDVRYLAAKQPRLITWSFENLRDIGFAVREEMGFEKDEVKSLLLKQPRLFMKNRTKLVEVFDYVHNTMKLSHDIIVKQPKILTCRIERLRQRHNYLEIVKKVQYDPTSPMYVSAEALISGTDLDFCRNVAKTTLETYNMYLKTL